MKRMAAIVVAGAILSFTTPSRAGVSENAPYYMCFAYTDDGMFFAGGDFHFERAQKMLSLNCGMPKRMTVVLMKTLMVRRDGRIQAYDPDGR